MPTLTVDGRRLHYLEEGERGVPVVLLHAFPMTAAMWRPQLDALRHRARVVAPDLAGSGGSEGPTEPESYSVDAWADDVAGVIRTLALPPVVLVGLSVGGYVAFALLRRHRELVGSLVLADTRAEADTPEARERRRDQQRRLAAGEVAPVADATAERLVGHGHRREEVMDQVRRSMMESRPEGLIGALDAMARRPDSTPDLEKIDVPTLVVVGEQDEASPLAVAEALQAAIPRARLAVVPDAGHLSNLENPDGFNRALEGLLDDLERRR